MVRDDEVELETIKSFVFGLIIGVIFGAILYWGIHNRHECITDMECVEMHHGQPGYGG